MPLGYSSRPWKLSFPHSKLGSSMRGRLWFLHPAPRCPRCLWVGAATTWVQHPWPRSGLLTPHISSGQRPRKPEEEKPQHLLLMCSPGLLLSVLSYCPFTWNTASIRKGQALPCGTCCSQTWQGSWLQQIFLLFKVAGTYSVIFLPRSCPRANPGWVDIWKQAIRLWPKTPACSHPVFDWFPKNRV